MAYENYMLCHECKEFVDIDFPQEKNVIQKFLLKHKNCGVNYFPSDEEVKQHNSAVHLFTTPDLHDALIGIDNYTDSFEDVGWNDFETVDIKE